MPPKQYQRPKNPPRYHSSDAVPQRTSSPAPPLPVSNLAPSDYTSDRESLGRRSPSPSISSAGSRASRKPVPVYNPADEPPVPAGAPRPNNPNPFAAANALVAMRSNESASRPVTPGAGQTRGGGGGGGREEDKVSPTNKAHNRRSTSPVGSPKDDDEDDLATLNFARRPSTFDPLAPSFHPSHNQSQASQGSRSLLPAGGRQQAQSQQQQQQKGQHQRQRSSHTRHPSISLGGGGGSGSPSVSPLPSPGFNPSFSLQQQQHQDGRKILPLQPAARPGGPYSKSSHADQQRVVEGTRAPIEAFASVEMLQGMRQASERSRGTEVFGPGGTYEGRASSISGEAGLPVRFRFAVPPWF